MRLPNRVASSLSYVLLSLSHPLFLLSLSRRRDVSAPFLPVRYFYLCIIGSGSPSESLIPFFAPPPNPLRRSKPPAKPRPTRKRRSHRAHPRAAGQDEPRSRCSRRPRRYRRYRVRRPIAGALPRSDSPRPPSAPSPARRLPPAAWTTRVRAVGFPREPRKSCRRRRPRIAAPAKSATIPCSAVACAL